MKRLLLPVDPGRMEGPLFQLSTFPGFNGHTACVKIITRACILFYNGVSFRFGF
jgi:hypothetical protein